MISTCSRSAPVRAASPARAAPALMARAPRSARSCGSAAPAFCAAACRKNCWFTARNSPSAFADAPGFGWTVPPATHDWGALIAAKDKELDRLHGIYVNMLNNAKVQIIDGRGVVVDPHTIEVNGKSYTAENILVATGGWPETPKAPRHRACHLVERSARFEAAAKAHRHRRRRLYRGRVRRHLRRLRQRGRRDHPPAGTAARVRRGSAGSSRRRNARPAASTSAATPRSSASTRPAPATP